MGVPKRSENAVRKKRMPSRTLRGQFISKVHSYSREVNVPRLADVTYHHSDRRREQRVAYNDNAGQQLLDAGLSSVRT